jgi:hypothetical protein
MPILTFGLIFSLLTLPMRHGLGGPHMTVWLIVCPTWRLGLAYPPLQSNQRSQWLKRTLFAGAILLPLWRV